jgi:hypothetical protein
MLPTPSQPLIEPGTRVRIAQRVRVGGRVWTTYVVGTVVDGGGVRPVGGMEMGSKSRFCYQPTVRLRLADGELAVVTVDEFTRYEVLGGAANAGAAP